MDDSAPPPGDPRHSRPPIRLATLVPSMSGPLDGEGEHSGDEGSSCLNSSVSTEFDDQAWIHSLQADGVACVALEQDVVNRITTAFAEVRQWFANDATTGVARVSSEAAHAVGYHDAGGLSRYNAHRRGLVYSDDARTIEGLPTFLSDQLQDLQDTMHAIAQTVLRGMEEALQLSSGYLEDTYGPTRTSSQFHVKEYVPGSARDDDNKLEDCDPSKQSWMLPTHTDPSLVSIVLLDRPGRQAGGLGLQYQRRRSQGRSEWMDLPWSGHAVAIVFVGSVGANVTNHWFPACRHGVRTVSNLTQSRIAATLFLRPAPNALLRRVPSPLIVTSDKTREPMPITFEAWNQRVSRNYQKPKK